MPGSVSCKSVDPQRDHKDSLPERRIPIHIFFIIGYKFNEARDADKGVVVILILHDSHVRIGVVADAVKKRIDGKLLLRVKSHNLTVAVDHLPVFVQNVIRDLF